MKWKLRAITIFGMLCCELGGTVYLNFWRNGFYNAIETRNWLSFTHYFEIFAVVAVILITIYSNRIYLTKILALKYRIYYTKAIQNQYVLKWKQLNIENGAQRINTDISDFFMIGTDLLSTITMSILTVILFSAVIYFTCKGLNFHVSWIYMVSYGYAIVGTGAAYLVGRSLVPASFNLQKCEADHRFGLSSVNHDVDDGEHDTRIDLVNAINTVVLKKQKWLMFVSSGFGQIQILIPFLIMSPFYFKGLITFGFLFQIAQAIDLLQQNLSCLINAYPQIVNYQATYQRIKALRGLL